MTKKKIINNFIGNAFEKPSNNSYLKKIEPHSGKVSSYFAKSSSQDVLRAVLAARSSFKPWSELTSVRRGALIAEIVREMENDFSKLARTNSIETGKNIQDAEAEVKASIMQGEFWASEGMRLYGRVLNSSNPNKISSIQYQPLGVVGLIVPANTPIANIAWKLFPALLCGNTVVLKSSENAPEIANIIASCCKKTSIPSGVINVLHGDANTGRQIVRNKSISLISFTGSSNVGKYIARETSNRLARISLELGGKNPFVVCNDANLDRAIEWAILSSFSNAGQRCASASNIFVQEDIYDTFKARFTDATSKLKLGIGSSDNLGPVITKKHRDYLLKRLRNEVYYPAKIITGGTKPSSKNLQKGNYLAPTIIEGLKIKSHLARDELFGPIACLFKFSNLETLMKTLNSFEYGLTSAIHTSDINKALWFTKRVRSGVANINMGTFGSEPHMPFGGFGISGNGTREPGLEAIYVYSEIKNTSIMIDNK